jgi:staphylococcal nuclease domain-containing protein 1
MTVDDANMSVSLVEEGLAKVHFTAEKSTHYRALCVGEEKSKAIRKNVSAMIHVSIVFHFQSMTSAIS